VRGSQTKAPIRAVVHFLLQKPLAWQVLVRGSDCQPTMQAASMIPRATESPARNTASEI